MYSDPLTSAAAINCVALPSCQGLLIEEQEASLYPEQSQIMHNAEVWVLTQPLQCNGYFHVFIYLRNWFFEAAPNDFLSGNNSIPQFFLSFQFAGDLKLHPPPLESA